MGLKLHRYRLLTKETNSRKNWYVKCCHGTQQHPRSSIWIHGLVRQLICLRLWEWGSGGHSCVSGKLTYVLGICLGWSSQGCRAYLETQLRWLLKADLQERIEKPLSITSPHGSVFIGIWRKLALSLDERHSTSTLIAMWKHKGVQKPILQLTHHSMRHRCTILL